MNDMFSFVDPCYCNSLNCTGECYYDAEEEYVREEC